MDVALFLVVFVANVKYCLWADVDIDIVRLKNLPVSK